MKETILIIACVLAILVGVLCAKAESPRQFTYLQVAVTQSVYENSAFSNKWNTAWIWLTGNTNTTEHWQGWDSSYRAIANTNITVYVYRNSLKNIKADLINTVTPAVRTNMIAKVKEHPQVEASINRTPDSSLAGWGIERKP